MDDNNDNWDWMDDMMIEQINEAVANEMREASNKLWTEHWFEFQDPSTINFAEVPPLPETVTINTLVGSIKEMEEQLHATVGIPKEMLQSSYITHSMPEDYNVEHDLGDWAVEFWADWQDVRIPAAEQIADEIDALVLEDILAEAEACVDAELANEAYERAMKVIE